MANFVFNIAKGRVAELATRVKNNDPAPSALVVILLASTGLEAQSTLEDVDSVTALVAGATNEATNTGYARKVLTDSELSAMTYAPDDTGNAFPIDIPDQTWTAVANDGTGAIGALVIAYDANTGSGTDSDILPLTHHTFAVTPDGSDITAQIASGGFYSAA